MSATPETTPKDVPAISLMDRICYKARVLCVPHAVHIDLTWKCNENCVHCYLDHRFGGDMDTAEVKDALDQLAAAGTLFLTISGGEIMLRKDIFEIVAHARSLLFDVRLKSNGILIGEREAERFAQLGVREVNISIYSHRPEVHDSITCVPGSFERSIEAVRRLKRHGIQVKMFTSLMRHTTGDYPQLQALAEELGVKNKFDPIITPRLDGDRTPTSFNVPLEALAGVYRDPTVIPMAEEYCAPPAPVNEEILDRHPCGAGHNVCYISPTGDVMPCVQYPLVCGNLRQTSFAEIWRSSPQFADVRGMRLRDSPICSACANASSCRRCPGLALMEGDALGPSRLDCESSYARTNIPTPLVP